MIETEIARLGRAVYSARHNPTAADLETIKSARADLRAAYKAASAEQRRLQGDIVGLELSEANDVIQSRQ